MTKKHDKAEMLKVPENVGSPWELDSIDNLLLKHLIKYPAATNQSLGDLVGLGERAIRARRSKPEFERAFMELTASTQTHLKEAARRAASRLKRLVDDDDKDIAMQAMKLALSNHLGNKQQVDVTLAPKIVYRTSVQVDGSLLQEVVEAEVAALPEAAKDDGPKEG